jgi:hypothetical protein
MSGYADEELRPRGALDADVVLVHKPFKAQQLGDQIRTVLDGEES